MGIEVTDNEILNNILNHMKIKGVRQTDVARYLGISDNAVSQWKTHTSKSYMKYLDQLAEYFDVSAIPITFWQPLEVFFVRWADHRADDAGGLGDGSAAVCVDRHSAPAERHLRAKMRIQ